MNVEHLRTFVEIVKRGSFSEAAKAFAVSQPAVTFQIQRLERDLAVRLLERGEGRVVMTPAGQRFYEFAQRVLAEQVTLVESLRELSEEVQGLLRLGASTVPGEYLVPRLLGEFTARYPAVEAAVQIADTDAVTQKVLSLECEVGFIGARIEEPGLKITRFVRDEIVLIVSPGHPWASQPSIQIEALAGERLLTREPGSGTMKNVRKLLQQAGFDPEHWTHAPAFGSTQAVLSAVEAGLGVAFVSRFAAEKSLRLGLVQAVSIEGVQLQRELYTIYQESRITTRLLQEFVTFAQSWGQTYEERLALVRLERK